MILKYLLNINIFIKLRKLLSNFPFDEDKVNKLQLIKLRRLLIYSYENFDFYKEIMDKENINPHELKSIKEIERFPIITKHQYREFTDSIVNKNPNLYSKYYIDATCGSTGIPLKIYRTWNERAYMLAKYLRTLFLNGYKITDVTFSIPSPHRISQRDFLFQKLGLMQRYCIAYTDSVENMVDGYQKVTPDLFYGNKAQLVQMSLYIREKNIAIKQPKLYICAGEILDENSKVLIQSIFGRDNMVEVYGSVEFNNLAFQLKGNDFFYFNHDTNILELEDNGVINDEKGNCLITDLHIYSFPLIRYRLGDRLETENKNGLRVIKKVQGRLDDWVKFRDGTKLPYFRFYEVMTQHLEVKQFRFIQENLGLMKVLVVLEDGIDKVEFENILLKDLRKDVSDKILYEIEYMNVIPPDPTGKIRMIISKIE